MTFKERLEYDNDEEKTSFSEKMGYMYKLLTERKKDVPESFKKNYSLVLKEQVFSVFYNESATVALWIRFANSLF